MEIHHVTYRSQGGADDPNNLLCVSPEAHRKIHSGEWAILEFSPAHDELTVANTETGELIEPLWWYDRPDRDADEAFRLFEQVKTIRREETKHRLMLGKILVKIEDGQLYETLGHDTMESFFGDPDVDLSRTTGYRYMRIYRRFVVIAQRAESVVDMGIRKADMISRFVGHPDTDLDEWIAKASTLSRSDLRREIQSYTVDDRPSQDKTAESVSSDGSEERPEPGYVTRIRQYAKNLSESETHSQRLEVLEAVRDVVDEQIRKLRQAVND